MNDELVNFIRRRAIIGYHIKNFLNIIKFTKRLLKVNFYNKTALLKLKTAIEREGIISEKRWLLKQLENVK